MKKTKLHDKIDKVLEDVLNEHYISENIDSGNVTPYRLTQWNMLVDDITDLLWALTMENKVQDKNKEEITIEEKMENLAKDIYDWCMEKEVWGNIIIYFNGKAWNNLPYWDEMVGSKIDNCLFEYRNKNPKDYFEYANPDTLSMSFEGVLNYILNGHIPGWVALEAEFKAIFKKYGYYFELGNAWNLSAYEI